MSVCVAAAPGLRRSYVRDLARADHAAAKVVGTRGDELIRQDPKYSWAVRIFLLTMCGQLCACYPSVGKYWRAAVPDAIYLNATCRGSFGPRSITYYPYHGIFISLWLGDGASPVLTLHIPPGTVAELNDKILQVHGQSPSGAVEVTLALNATVAGMKNAGPDKVYGTRTDTYTLPNNFGPLKGGEDRGIYLWYEYGADAPIPAGVISGTLTFPSLTINGQPYDAQTVPFRKEKFIGVAPINC